MTIQPGGGGGVLSILYLSNRDVLFSGYHFHLSFLMGYQKKAIFLKQVVKKHVKGGNFVGLGYYLAQFLCFGVYFSLIFSRIRYHLKAKILEPCKKLLWAHHHANLCQVPPGPSRSRPYLVYIAEILKNSNT